MVFLATTRRAYDECVALRSGNPIWVLSGVVSDAEAESVRATGLNLTRFTSPVAYGDQTSLSRALETIREHHGDETIWVAL